MHLRAWRGDTSNHDKSLVIGDSKRYACNTHGAESMQQSTEYVIFEISGLTGLRADTLSPTLSYNFSRLCAHAELTSIPPLSTRRGVAETLGAQETPVAVN